MNVVFFDGSARTMDHFEAADPALYAPEGSFAFDNAVFLEEYREKYPRWTTVP
jgi:hypothetical protein